MYFTLVYQIRTPKSLTYKLLDTNLKQPLAIF